MLASKIAVSIESDTLTRLDRLVRQRRFPNRSKAVHEAIDALVARAESRRLDVELAKIDPDEERRLSEEGFGNDGSAWPEY